MNVFLSENSKEQIPGDLLVRWVNRSDLSPVPRTLELTYRVKSGLDERLQVGSFVWTGRENLKYRIVKTAPGGSPALVQGKDPVAVRTVTALLDACTEISYRRERAVIRENANLAALYRACGCNVAIADDITIPRFSCFVGQVPSFAIVQALQEESAAILLREGRLSVARLSALFQQTPVDTIQQDDGGIVDSEFQERHEIAAFLSLDDNGAFVNGAFETPRARLYMPRTDEQRLRNMTRVLVTRRIVDSRLAQQIIAGDLLVVGGEKLVVITAAHAFVQNEGNTETSSRFWCGRMSR